MLLSDQGVGVCCGRVQRRSLRRDQDHADARDVREAAVRSTPCSRLVALTLAAIATGACASGNSSGAASGSLPGAPASPPDGRPSFPVAAAAGVDERPGAAPVECPPPHAAADATPTAGGTEAECERLREDVQRAIDRATRCTSDADCAARVCNRPCCECPFGGTQAGAAEVQALWDAYVGAGCPDLCPAFPCPPRRITCQDGRCR